MTADDVVKHFEAPMQRLTAVARSSAAAAALKFGIEQTSMFVLLGQIDVSGENTFGLVDATAIENAKALLADRTLLIATLKWAFLPASDRTNPPDLDGEKPEDPIAPR